MFRLEGAPWVLRRVVAPVRRDVSARWAPEVLLTASLGVDRRHHLGDLIAIPAEVPLPLFRPRSLWTGPRVLVLDIGIATHPVWIGVILPDDFGAELDPSCR